NQCPAVIAVTDPSLAGLGGDASLLSGISFSIDIGQQSFDGFSCSSLQQQPDASFEEETPGFRLSHCYGNDAVTTAFIEAIRKQPVRIQSFFEEIDRPGEMDLAIDGGEIVRVAIRTFEADEGFVCHCGVEVFELRPGRSSAKNDFEAPFHPSGEIREQFKRTAAPQSSEPADLPGLSRSRSCGGRNRRLAIVI